MGQSVQSIGPQLPSDHHTQVFSSTPTEPEYRLDIRDLDATVQQLFVNGLVPLMNKNYHSGSKRFVSFCNRNHITVPFPVSKQLLSCFAAYFCKEGLKGGTVKSYMAAVRHAQISLGLRDPRMSDMPQLGYIIRGFKKATGGPPSAHNTRFVKSAEEIMVPLDGQEWGNVVGCGLYVLFWLPALW